MEPIRIEQLMKQMVAEELAKLPDPCASAAMIVLKTLTAALPLPPEPAAAMNTIEDVIKGAMTALLLADQNLCRGAMLILEVVLEVSAERHLDPTQSMAAALHALADLRRFVEPDRIEELRREIDARYMGAGDLFRELLRAPLPPAQTPPARPVVQ